MVTQRRDRNYKWKRKGETGITNGNAKERHELQMETQKREQDLQIETQRREQE